MKHFFFSILFLFAANAMLAQNSEGSADDAARIPIKAYVPTDIGDITSFANSAILAVMINRLSYEDPPKPALVTMRSMRVFRAD